MVVAIPTLSFPMTVGIFSMAATFLPPVAALRFMRKV